MDIDKVKKILDEPVVCTDGRSHSIDESCRRYLASQICQLFKPKPDESRLIDTRIIQIDPHPKAPFIDITDLLKAQRDLTAFIKDTEYQAGDNE